MIKTVPAHYWRNQWGVNTLASVLAIIKKKYILDWELSARMFFLITHCTHWISREK